MLNQKIEPKATPVLNDDDRQILSTITERRTAQIAMLECMPRDGSPIALRTLIYDMEQLTDPVHPYVTDHTEGYPSMALRMVKRKWSCCHHQGRGWINKDPVTDLWSYLDGGLDQALDEHDTPENRMILDIMIRARDHQADIDVPNNEVVDPLEACVIEKPTEVVKTTPVAEPTADVETKITGPSVEDIIRQQIQDNYDNIDRLKQILKDHYGSDA